MTDYLFNNVRKLQWSLVLGDLTLILISTLVTYITMSVNSIGSNASDSLTRHIPMWIALIAVYFLLAYVMDQYDLYFCEKISENVGRLLRGLIPWGIVISALLFMFSKSVVDKRAMIICLFSVSALFLLWRSVGSSVIRKHFRHKRLAIVGYEKNVSLFSKELTKLSFSGMELNTVYIIDRDEAPRIPFAKSVSVQKEFSDLLQYGEFDILALDATNGHFSADQLRSILQHKDAGKTVRDLASLYENVTGKVPISAIDTQWLLQNSEFQRAGGKFYRNVKRILDVMMAGCLLVIGSPLLGLLAVAVRMESHGPALFVQERLGVHKKPFRCYKFRTMVENAESESGPVWATGNDPRITRVGRILRKSRLDELPQLWNIVKGEMTFVGPRPIREHFANHLTQFIPYYGLRFCVKPGLTGWAQVNYDYAGSDEGQMEKFQYDLFYILNMSLKLDLLALFKTCKTVIRRAGV